MIAESAPAKLNLALHVTGRRADGFHSLETLVAFTELADVVRVRSAERDEFAITGPFATALGGDGPNLVERARDALRATVPSAPPAAITLEKNLPVASGIGGGSADAAAALRALARLWSAPSDVNTMAIAETLGSDVPMCVASRAAIATGCGEHLEFVTLPALAELDVVMVNPGVAVSTPKVFAALRERNNPGLSRPPNGQSVTELLDWLRECRNDLEAPARGIAPTIGETLSALRDAAFARMSGSGATCFGLFHSSEAAEAVRTRIAADHPQWFITRTRFTQIEVAA